MVLTRPLRARLPQQRTPSGGYSSRALTASFGNASSGTNSPGFERYRMRDLKSDWKRWSRAERIGAIVIVAAFIVCGSSIVGNLTGGSGGRPGFLPGTSAEWSGTHGSQSIHQ
jgi:hypothetical protein